MAIVIGSALGIAILYSLVLLAATLGWTGKRPRTPFESLKDKDPVIRRLAASELGARPGANLDLAIEALGSALQDGDNWVRWEAARSLGKIGVPAKSSIPALRKALEDEDDRVRDRAAQALKQIDPETEEAKMNEDP